MSRIFESSRGESTIMESSLRYYLRRAAEERTLALRSITPQARERHTYLAGQFAARAEAIAPQRTAVTA